tara:strand:+ start:144 stop:605 length:462 start_codon:yes stop_codon:yes gene_type:complete
MNQIFFAVIALVISFILWGSKNESKRLPFLKSKNTSFLNQNEITSLVQKKKLNDQKKVEILKNFQSKPNSIEIKKKLNKLICSNPNDRLLAIQIASKWENKKAIPFLRRGLKDSDSRVVIASAAAILSHKGKAINLKEKYQTPRPPRNVFLMR